MADSQILGLFTSPEQYQANQMAQFRQQAANEVQLNPFQQAAVGMRQAGYQLGGGIGGALGGQDPQLQIIAKRQALMGMLKKNDPESYATVADLATSNGDPQFGMLLMQEGRKLAESLAETKLKTAQAEKAGLPPKLTGDERFIASLSTVESKLRKGEEVSSDELSNANMSAQMLSKPRTFFDQASGQLVTNPATDPSKAFPLTFKKFMTPEEATANVNGTPIMPSIGGTKVEQITEGSLPTAVIQDVASIDKQLEQIKNRAPELNKFLTKIESGQVKYDLATNAWDFGGSVIPPIFGAKSFGNQVEKDEIQRALTSRVNAVLNSAKGVQAKDDAQRAKDQIASPSTFLSSDRMASAIRDLQKAEASLESELEVEKRTLTSKAKPTKTPSTTKSFTSQTSEQPVQKQGKTYTDEEKIQLFQKSNPKKNRAEIVNYLRSTNQIK